MIQATEIIGTGLATTGLIGAGVGIGVVIGVIFLAVRLGLSRWGRSFLFLFLILVILVLFYGLGDLLDLDVFLSQPEPWIGGDTPEGPTGNPEGPRGTPESPEGDEIWIVVETDITYEQIDED